MPAAAKPGPKATAKPAAGRILIVEDDSDILEVLKLMLEYEGHKVVTAKRGAAALEAAREKAFDVAVLDISMPDMSGIEVAQALRADARTAGVRIAIHTGVEERWVKQRFADYDHYFAKARDVDVLVAGIARLLSATPRTASAAAPGSATPAPAPPAATTSSAEAGSVDTAASAASTVGDAAAGPTDATYEPDDVLRARTALRRALGHAAPPIGLDAFLAALGDEIGALRQGGQDDAAIAMLIGEAIGRPVPANAVATAPVGGQRAEVRTSQPLPTTR